MGPAHELQGETQLMKALLPSPKGRECARISSGKVANSALRIPSVSVFRPSSLGRLIPFSSTCPVTTIVFIDPISLTSSPTESMYRSASTLCGIVTAAPPNVGERIRSRTDSSSNEAVS